MLKYKKPLAISSWITFAVSLAIYWITADEGVSYWDCPEYVTVASKLEIGHPPGNPVWMLAMRFITIPFPPYLHAYVINLASGLLMAFASFFLCRLIFIPTRIFFTKKFGKQNFSSSYLDVLASFISIGAAFCFAVCDSAWFSAVEAEVYAMSTFLSALSLWLMMLWWFAESKGYAFRLLILLAYITGLSLGVHQLNLLLIPVFAVIILYKKHPRRLNPAYVVSLILISIGIIALILLGIMPGTLYVAESFEIFGVNVMGWGYNSGVIVFACLLLALIIISLVLVNAKTPKRNLTLAIWMFAFILLGYSSFSVILIRANAAPPMNTGSPDNIFSLASYIARDQYASPPLLYGATPYSRQLFIEDFIDGSPHYTRYALKKKRGDYTPVMPEAALYPRSGLMTKKDSLFNESVLASGHGYIISDYLFQQRFTPELDMWFPRITSRTTSDRAAYKGWAGMTEQNMMRVRISEAIDSNGNLVTRLTPRGVRSEVFSYRPTYFQNLRFFLSYQTYYMYFRYLFWNFIGRQNDFPSSGEIEHGNFVTGIPVIDSNFLGVTSNIPSEIWGNNKGRNIYFGIPFFIGIAGILWLLSGNYKRRRILTITTLIFLMTGLAIVIYLNQSPGEPRERDYTFLMSYMAFAMWIAAGFICIAVGIVKLLPARPALLLSCLFALGPASLMAFENFDDHDRSNRFEPEFYASSVLDFELPAIIFSHGDNSTFPQWYAMEVLGMGANHIPVDVTYLSLPDYIINLKKQGLPSISPSPFIAFNKYRLTKIPDDSISVAMPINEAIRTLYASADSHPVFPTSKVVLPSSRGDSVTVNLHSLTGGSSNLSFRQLMLLDIIASQLEASDPKVIYFPSWIQYSFYKSLEPALLPTLFGKIYAPWIPDSLTYSIYKTSIIREIHKLKALGIKDRYTDPLITDRNTRYRGEMVIAAGVCLENGDTVTANDIVDCIINYYPYEKMLPGTFTIADSTFYEGKEFLKLIKRMNSKSGNCRYNDYAARLDSAMIARRKEWLRYYNSLSPSQRATLSNRSKRLLIN